MEGQEEARRARGVSRRRESCHFTDTPSPSVLKHLLKGEGGAAEWQARRVWGVQVVTWTWPVTDQPATAIPAGTPVSTYPPARVLSFCCTPPLPSVGVSTGGGGGGGEQNNSLADGDRHQLVDIGHRALSREAFSQPFPAVFSSQQQAAGAQGRATRSRDAQASRAWNDRISAGPSQLLSSPAVDEPAHMRATQPSQRALAGR